MKYILLAFLLIGCKQKTEVISVTLSRPGLYIIQRFVAGDGIVIGSDTLFFGVTREDDVRKRSAFFYQITPKDNTQHRNFLSDSVTSTLITFVSMEDSKPKHAVYHIGPPGQIQFITANNDTLTIDAKPPKNFHQ